MTMPTAADPMHVPQRHAPGGVSRPIDDPHKTVPPLRYIASPSAWNDFGRSPVAPFLTIAVPTYNRAVSLRLLLDSLRTELAGLDGEVRVLVSDNASTDDTPTVTNAIQEAWPALDVQRNDTNVGPEENFCRCLDRIDSRYFWILGDDDLPKSGVVCAIVSLLKAEAPALIYMQSEWVSPVTGPDQGEPVGALDWQSMAAPAFARRVHVWLTFISGFVVDRERLMTALGTQSIRRHVGTSLVQLGWVLPVMQRGEKLIFVASRCLLATKDNTGGYALLTVFGANFPRLVREELGEASRLPQNIVAGTVWEYLPGLIWNSRVSDTFNFEDESPWKLMQRELGYSALFWLLLVPIGRFPKALAMPVFQVWRVLNRLQREFRARSLRRVPRRPALS